MVEPIISPDLKSRPFDLKVERFMTVTPDMLYRAWTKHIDHWFAAPGTVLMKNQVNEVFFFETVYKAETDSDMQRHPHYGRFLQLEQDRLIKLTWITEGTKGAETVVTVELEPQDNGNGTMLVLTHAGFPDEQSRNQHKEAWPMVLEQLNKKLL